MLLKTGKSLSVIMTPCSHLQEDNDIVLIYICKLILLPSACRSSTAAEDHPSIL